MIFAPTEMLPLVSVLTPTHGRPALLANAVRMFNAYPYPRKEMIVVDDSPTPAALPASPFVKYIHLKERPILGEKHNIAVRAAQGEILVHHDDDDYYNPRRLAVQLEGIVLGRTDISGFPVNYVLDAKAGKFYHFRPGIRFNLVNEPDAHIRFGFHDSTSAYHRRVWEAGIRYPQWAGGEKLAFANHAIEWGFRHETLKNFDQFVYVRHGRNTWHYRDWLIHVPTSRPVWFPQETLEAYRRAS